MESLQLTVYDFESGVGEYPCRGTGLVACGMLFKHEVGFEGGSGKDRLNLGGQ